MLLLLSCTHQHSTTRHNSSSIFSNFFVFEAADILCHQTHTSYVSTTCTQHTPTLPCEGVLFFCNNAHTMCCFFYLFDMNFPNNDHISHGTNGIRLNSYINLIQNDGSKFSDRPIFRTVVVLGNQQCEKVNEWVAVRGRTNVLVVSFPIEFHWHG